MADLPFYKQNTTSACGLACLRMVFASFGKFFTEYNLSKITSFDPDRGISPKMLSEICNILNFDYEYRFEVDIETLSRMVKQKIYAIVSVNPGLLYQSLWTEYGHYVIVKDITNGVVIINDPDQEYGGENKIIPIQNFLESWTASYNFMLVVRGEFK